MATTATRRSLFDPTIVRQAVIDSFRKLDPRHMARNPVMFIVEIGSVFVTILWLRDIGDADGDENVFAGLVAAWLWFTVLFANFAEAMAEGRGKAQAATLRQARSETMAHRRNADGTTTDVASSQLGVGDVCVVSAGEMIPSDGEVIEGIASVDESAITGESAPVIRESGGDRSAVTGGTRVLSDQIVVRITARAGETFLDRMIALVEGASRQKTPNEIALNILLSGLTIIFLLATVTLQPFSIYSGDEQSMVILVALLVCLIPTTIGALLSAIGIAGMDRLVQRNVLAMSGSGRRGGRRLRHVAARQDGHDHARQPPGGRVPGPAGGRGVRARRGRPAGQPHRRDAGGPVHRRAGQGALRPARTRAAWRRARPVHRPDAHERRRPRRAAGAQGRRRIRASVGRGARRHRAGGPRSARRGDRHRRRHAARRRRRGPQNGDVAVRVLGVIHLKDIVKQGMSERFDELRRMGIRTVMITGDNPLTARAIATEAGVDDFLAEATPEDKMRLIKSEQEGGRLVAMTGDGTNDAPALAQADVGVAMNTGTQAAKEAGNMVDLDSNPTKLIEIVEIGKQLLITRGSLTTFSIANDVAKYFAIIPAMFVGVFPQLDTLNVMDLQSPRSAILSAVIFNALIIVALIPLALRGVKFVAAGAAAVLRRNILIYGVGGIIIPVHRDQAHRRHHHRAGSELMRAQLLAGLRALLVLTVLCGLAYPLVVTGIAQLAFNDKANGSLIERDGVVVGSSLIGQQFSSDEYFHSRPSAAGARAVRRDRDSYRRETVPADPSDLSLVASGASNLGPTNEEFLTTVAQRVEAYRQINGLPDDTPVPVDAVTASGSGLDPHISIANAELQAQRVADARGLPLEEVLR